MGLARKHCSSYGANNNVAKDHSLHVWLICILFFLFVHGVFISLSGHFSVFAIVKERTREGNDLYREMIEKCHQASSIRFPLRMRANVLLFIDR
ncbi:hypothetical protein Taro_002096 [Colocasia esculenta]|uniref:Uncharacterized protein n=1 Tax=Colocasia esculenta TaxID=4460 RepID=A0A843TGE8_COLES|nr:hypothetical protein [Colocasia esculenta]